MMFESYNVFQRITMFTYIVNQVLNTKTRYYSWRNKMMHISLDEVQFHANRLVWTSLPLSLAAGIGAIVLLNLCLCKWINKLANQDWNIAKRIFYLLSSNKHSAKYRNSNRTFEPEQKLSNHAPTVKVLFPV
jgi:hypothetical protein